VAAVICFYQQIGMFYEDIAANLIAWGAWGQDRGCLLADLMERISLKRGVSTLLGAGPYHEVAVRQLLGSKKGRCPISPFDFLKSLSSISGERLLAFLGLPWKRHMSVKQIAKSDRGVWEQLPERLHELVETVGGDRSELVTLAYNKVKHGPQIVISDVFTVAAKLRGFDAVACRNALPVGEHVRLLFRGATTQENPQDRQKGKHLAPFLLDDPAALSNILFGTIVGSALEMAHVGHFLLRLVIGRQDKLDFDPGVRTMVRSYFQWLTEQLRKREIVRRSLQSLGFTQSN